MHKPLGERNPMIARGAFGEISVAIWTGKDRWRFVAIKTIIQSTTSNASLWSSSLSSSLAQPAASNAKLSREVFHEICALQLLNPHPNIVDLLAVYPTHGGSAMSGSSLSLAFQYCPIDLYTTLEWRRRSLMPLLPFHVIKGVAFDIFSALNHCHSKGVLHLDVKAGNLLVSSRGIVQLCDFGLAKPYLQNGKSNVGEESRGLCTLFYRPPELLLGGPADSPAIDNYSAGVVLSELLTGFPLFRGKYMYISLFQTLMTTS